MEQNKNVKDQNSANKPQSADSGTKTNSRSQKSRRAKGRHVDNTVFKDRYKTGETVDGKILLFFKADKQHHDKSALIKLAKGGIALLHFSEIMGHPVNKIENLYKVGEKLTVEIAAIKPEQNRCSVSLIPVMRRHYIAQLERGTVCEATVVRKVAYGYFVDLGDGLTALLHKSDLQFDSNDKDEKLEIGAKTKVVVLSVEDEGKRIAVGRIQLL